VLITTWLTKGARHAAAGSIGGSGSFDVAGRSVSVGSSAGMQERHVSLPLICRRDGQKPACKAASSMDAVC
jgi:hypothetical protein